MIVWTQYDLHSSFNTEYGDLGNRQTQTKLCQPLQLDILLHIGHHTVICANANIGFLIPQMITFPKMYNLAHPQKLPTQVKLMTFGSTQASKG